MMAVQNPPHEAVAMRKKQSMLFLAALLLLAPGVAPLRQLLHNHIIRIGSAASAKLLGTEARYADVLAREFNYLVGENDMKWAHVEPAQGQWTFHDADALVDFAVAHGMQVRGHTLVWHNALPDYVKAITDPTLLRNAMTEHIKGEVSHFKGRIAVWDVVNEAVRDDGKGLRQTPFSEILGPGYIADAFRATHAADPHALLLYNDYGGEGRGVKSDAIYALVKDLVAQGVPIGGVGLQMHLDLANHPSAEDIAWNMRRYAALGLKIHINEMDVRIGLAPGDETARLDLQRALYHDVVATCVAQPACDSVTFWGFTDAHSWLNVLKGPGQEPLLFDADYNAKPAWFGVADALLGR